MVPCRRGRHGALPTAPAPRFGSLNFTTQEFVKVNPFEWWDKREDPTNM